MALFRGEREPSTAIDPVIAFMHDENNPPSGIVDISGKIVPSGTEHKFYGPPLPIILTDTSNDTERILGIQEQAAIPELLEPQAKAGAIRPQHIRRPLSIRRLAAFISPSLG